MKKQPNHYTPGEKVAILRRHLLDNEHISKLCDELGVQPTVFYRRQKEFFENGAVAFERKHSGTIRPEPERIAYCLYGEQNPEQRRGSGRADGWEHVALKKTSGNSDRGLTFRTIRGSDAWISSGLDWRRPRSSGGVVGASRGWSTRWRTRGHQDPAGFDFPSATMDVIITVPTM
jgi:transposase